MKFLHILFIRLINRFLKRKNNYKTPILSNEIDKVEQSSKSKLFTVSSNSNNSYPVLIRSTQKQLLNINYSIQKRRIGVSEEKFYTEVFNEFQTKIYNSISVRKDNIVFEPDIAYIDKEKNIYIDIEIDEPYSINRNGEFIPTHINNTP